MKGGASRGSPELALRTCVLGCSHDHFGFHWVQICVFLQVVKARVKDLMIPRYKIIVTISIGQLAEQTVRMVSRCLWDATNDTFSSYVFKNNSLFAVSNVYAVYFEWGCVWEPHQSGTVGSNFKEFFSIKTWNVIFKEWNMWGWHDFNTWVDRWKLSFKAIFSISPDLLLYLHLYVHCNYRWMDGYREELMNGWMDMWMDG